MIKKLKIWIQGFSLLQQFLGLVFISVAFFIVFASGSFNFTVENYVNNQLYKYLSDVSTLKIESINNNGDYDDNNVKFYLYDNVTDSYDLNVSVDDLKLLSNLEIINKSAIVKGTFDYDGTRITYVSTPFKDNVLITIANDSFRQSYEENIMSVVLNVALVFAFSILIFFWIWIFTLIIPLNNIRNYVEKIRSGEKAELNFARQDEIGEVADAITSMKMELDKQNAIKEEMIHNISHDLKTPIATIKSYSESIKDGIYPYGTLEKSVDVIIEHANRLEKKVYSLLTLNRMGYLSDVSSDTEVNMNEIISKAILSCEVLRNDIKIIDNLDDDIYFHGEEEPWRVVVENLLDNALRYAKSKVTITLADGLLEVYNDGQNMDKERIDKLFKPYEKGTKGKFGLGLSIVKRVTETYGYKVSGENMVDGVVFRIIGNIKTKKGNKKLNKG